MFPHFLNDFLYFSTPTPHPNHSAPHLHFYYQWIVVAIVTAGTPLLDASRCLTALNFSKYFPKASVSSLSLRPFALSSLRSDMTQTCAFKTYIGQSSDEVFPLMIYLFNSTTLVSNINLIFSNTNCPIR